MPTVYYPTGNCGTGGTVPAYTCSPCPTYEFGRIRSVAIIDESFTFTDPTLASEWNTGITTGKITVIWETQGSYDGGSTSELAGFGDRETTNGGTVHTLTFKDPNYKDNADFYNAIRSVSTKKIAFRTSNSIHLVDVPVTLTPKNPIADDTKSNVVWEVQAKWSSPDSPVPYDTPANIFDSCYYYA